MDLQTQVMEMLQLDGEIEEMEDRLGALKKKREILSSKTIPGIMENMGLESTILTGGVSVLVRRDVFSSATRARMPAIVASLREWGMPDLIRASLFSPMDPHTSNDETFRANATSALARFNLVPEFREEVNTQTLKKVVRERLALNEPVPLPDLGLFEKTETKIKLRT